MESRELTGHLVDKLKKDFASKYVNGIMQFGQSGCVLPRAYQKNVSRVKALEVRPDDIWVLSHPKCGTTWTQEMVWLSTNNLDYEEALAVPLTDRFPFMEFSCFMTPEECAERNTSDTLVRAEQQTSPRFIKSHLTRDLLPDQLWTVKPKMLYVARDAKDTALSYYHHNRLLNGYTGSIDDFCEAFFEGILMFNPFWDHVQSFWELRNEPFMMFNTFENMKKDLRGVIRRTADFLEKPLTDQQLSTLEDHLHISKMRDNSSVNMREKITKMRESGKLLVDGEFIRKGDVGDGCKAMTQEMVAKYNARTKEKLLSKGYPDK